MEEDGSGDQLVGEIVGDMVEGMKETKDSISTHLARGRGSPKFKVNGAASKSGRSHKAAASKKKGQASGSNS